MPALTTFSTRDPYQTTERFEFRLSNNLEVQRYDLLLRTFFDPYEQIDYETVDANLYNGELVITFDLKSSTNRIVFHMDRSLSWTNEMFPLIQSVSTNQSVAVKSKRALPNQLYEVITENMIQTGSYRLKMLFQGELGKNGFYWTSYSQNNGFR